MESVVREPNRLNIRRDSKFNTDFLLSVKQGTLLMAEDLHIGKSRIPEVYNYASAKIDSEEGIGYQFYPTALMIKIKDEFVIKHSSSKPKFTFDNKLRNSVVYAASDLSVNYQIKSNKNGFPIGLVLGDVLEGTNFVLMKILTADSIGWICFFGETSDKMELQ